MAARVPYQLERLHELLAPRAREPLWTVLTLLFLRAAHSLDGWAQLLQLEGDELIARVDELLSGLHRRYPHQFPDGSARIVERVDQLNHGQPLRPLLEQTGRAFEQVVRAGEEGDAIGQAYMLLLPKARAGWNGEFYTPNELALLMARILAPEPGNTVLDPACGSGRLLLAALEACRERHGEEGAASVQLYGIELNPETAQVARLNMILAGAGDQALIATADALAGPVFINRSGEPATFDVVISNPPFGSGRRR